MEFVIEEKIGYKQEHIEIVILLKRFIKNELNLTYSDNTIHILTQINNNIDMLNKLAHIFNETELILGIELFCCVFNKSTKNINSYSHPVQKLCKMMLDYIIMNDASYIILNKQFRIITIFSAFLLFKHGIEIGIFRIDNTINQDIIVIPQMYSHLNYQFELRCRR